MQAVELERAEIELLLEAIYQRYSYDFRSYARASIERRVRRFCVMKEIRRISDLIPMCLHDEAVFSQLAQHFSISVTEMFRDPHVYRALREQVVPLLKSFPFLKVWHAGCATGEEVYSLAILLHEEGLGERATIYGTDFNDAVLDQARQGIYSNASIQEATRNYQEAGGRRSFSDYYHSEFESAKLESFLAKRIVFANHNLTQDQVFGEMHLVFCRNVLIYFNRELQDRALGLFADSLVRGGFLCLGAKEDLRFSAVASQFEGLAAKARIYKKKVQ